jgi:hypothetical protein
VPSTDEDIYEIFAIFAGNGLWPRLSSPLTETLDAAKGNARDYPGDDPLAE